VLHGVSYIQQLSIIHGFENAWKNKIRKNHWHIRMIWMIKLGGEYVSEMLLIIDLKLVSSAFQNAESHFVRRITIVTCFYGPERRFIVLTE
jgi:hypothetical protein